ncbi:MULTISPECIES: Na(+)/H(+) antiporter subunit B [Halobacillus]|uniref:Na(+)/H(+) antiporter subunit B n=3 Tax=Halobacillus TaxID=45667 RepID=A0A3D8VGM8_9BACI|nr:MULTISPECIES: Na(+)/H(+) antiporter subunit B [Halobacillus]MBX0356349.1 Na(+)/H(+) antiporter subunit B [Halobacillus sp. Nhm2S1]RDY68526.1 Na(+)/H(+) antiporter subunit B [Halobacillus trueperi]REJ09605.1 Na(+)/H(+) antiporter subunit B [Halobacillus trueperi]SDP81311.1 multicomponent Na+:H+ antiporter subunit B [Halobacillus aidingensis]GEN54047.1 Na(+)/H(+) antiporter subunit B [Halobacillus faecis]
MTQTNDIILRTTTTLIAFILLGFSVYLFFAGHNAPGGGFIGGLMTAAAIILMYMAYGSKAMEKILPINFRFLIPVGLMVAAATGIGGMVFDAPFLTQTFAYFQLPILGKTELATALLFDLGVYLAVVGVTMTIILTIAYDRE